MIYRRAGRSGLDLPAIALVTSALIGASRVSQMDDTVAALDRLALSDNELRDIDQILL